MIVKMRGLRPPPTVDQSRRFTHPVVAPQPGRPLSASSEVGPDRFQLRVAARSPLGHRLTSGSVDDSLGQRPLERLQGSSRVSPSCPANGDGGSDRRDGHSDRRTRRPDRGRQRRSVLRNAAGSSRHRSATEGGTGIPQASRAEFAFVRSGQANTGSPWSTRRDHRVRDGRGTCAELLASCSGDWPR